MTPIRATPSLLKAVGLATKSGWHPNKKRVPSDKTKIIRIAKGRAGK